MKDKSGILSLTCGFIVLSTPVPGKNKNKNNLKNHITTTMTKYQIKQLKKEKNKKTTKKNLPKIIINFCKIVLVVAQALCIPVYLFSLLLGIKNKEVQPHA